MQEGQWKEAPHSKRTREHEKKNPDGLQYPHNCRFMKELQGDPKKAQDMQICTYEHSEVVSVAFIRWSKETGIPDKISTAIGASQGSRSSDLIGLAARRDDCGSQVEDYYWGMKTGDTVTRGATVNNATYLQETRTLRREDIMVIGGEVVRQSLEKHLEGRSEPEWLTRWWRQEKRITGSSAFKLGELDNATNLERNLDHPPVSPPSERDWEREPVANWAHL